MSQLRRPASALALLLAAACASTGEGERDGPEPFVSRLGDDDREVGYFLAELDRSIRKWNEIVLEGSSEKDAHRVVLLEEAIAYEAGKRHEDLVDQLVTGPPYNRQIAAAALGFGRDPVTGQRPDALGPLLGALDDPEPGVVSNALLSLGALQDPATPLVPIAEKLTDGRTATVRNNAGRTLRVLVGLGVELEGREEARAAARRAIGDPDEGVRVHACLLLAQLEDFDAITLLAGALDDDVPLVARAASRALARLGSVDPQHKGPCARALAAALLRVDTREVRPAVFKDLQALARRNYGDEPEDWIEWAARLP